MANPTPFKECDSWRPHLPFRQHDLFKYYHKEKMTPKEYSHYLRLDDLLQQLKRSRDIKEPTHSSLYKGKIHGKTQTHDHQTLIDLIILYTKGEDTPDKLLPKMTRYEAYRARHSYKLYEYNMKNRYGWSLDKAPDLRFKINPFYQHIAYGLIGQTSYQPKVLNSAEEIIELQKVSIETLLAKEYMPPNDCFMGVVQHMLDDMHHCMPKVRLPYMRGDRLHPASSDDSVYQQYARPAIFEQYSKEPEPSWSAFSTYGTAHDYRDSMIWLDRDNSRTEPSIEAIQQLFRTLKAEYPRSYQIFRYNNDWAWPAHRYYDERKDRLFKALDNLITVLGDNDARYKELGCEYQYYYEYLFNNYQALDDFSREYQKIEHEQSRNYSNFFRERHSIAHIKALEAVKEQAFKKLMILTEIKLTQGWQHVVSDGKRADLNKVFSKFAKTTKRNPILSCLNTLFKSKQWPYYQGRIANAAIYFRQDNDVMNSKEFEILVSFASHLIKNHHAAVKKEVLFQAILVTIIITAMCLGIAALSMPGGAMAHALGHEIEAAVLMELLASFTHLAKGVDELKHELPVLALSGTQLATESLKPVKSSDMKGLLKLSIFEPDSEQLAIQLDETAMTTVFTA